MLKFEGAKFTYCSSDCYDSLVAEETEGSLSVDLDNAKVVFHYEDANLILENVNDISIELTNVTVFENGVKYSFELSNPEYDENEEENIIKLPEESV